MKAHKSIRRCLKEITVVSVVVIGIVMITCFCMYSIKKAKVAEHKIQSELKLNLKNQLAMFLPSYLLPEQKQGIYLILERIKLDEGLEHRFVIESKNELPSQFSHCISNPSQATSCSSKDQSSTAIIAPLAEGNHLFGYLFKSKMVSSAESYLGIVRIAGTMLLILALTCMVIYYFFSRLVNKTPVALDNLVSWIEAEINGKAHTEGPLFFKELEDVKIRISEIIESHNKSRDQAVIGQITSGIMHDIKTPLQSIVTAVHLVAEQEADSPKRLSRLENLYRMCSNNIPLIGNIIETTLDGNRNIVINKTTGNLKDTLESSVLLLDDFSKKRNVRIEVEACEEASVNYDTVQFTRVLNNLLKNGIEAASESTSLPLVKVSMRIVGESLVKILFEDSGKGFEIQPEKAFRAFRTTKIRGTGLGLLITKKIVEAHNGKIVASNSSLLGGARMEVTIPVS